MKVILLYCVFGLLAFKASGQTSPCFLLYASSIDSVKTIESGFGSIKQTQTGIQDTITTNLTVTVKDAETGVLLKNAAVIILKKSSKLTDEQGIARFIGFSTGGTFTLLISLKNYHCIEISNLYFGTGYIRHIEIKLKKGN